MRQSHRRYSIQLKSACAHRLRCSSLLANVCLRYVTHLLATRSLLSNREAIFQRKKIVLVFCVYIIMVI